MSEIVLIKSLFSGVKAIWCFIRYFGPKSYNLLTRPKLTIKFVVTHFTYILPDKTERFIQIPHLEITNLKNKKIIIRADLVSFNNERYTTMWNNEILRDLYGQQAQEKPIANTEIVWRHYKESWSEIVEGRSPICLDPGHTKIFPIILLGSAISNLRAKKRNSKLFSFEKKISLTLNVNNKDFEYGLCRTAFYEKYLNYLASYTARYKPANYI